MPILFLGGSPSRTSRSSALLDWSAHRLKLRGTTVDRLAVRDLPAQGLLHADVADPAIVRALNQVSRARALVLATPVYKAAYSGALKVFLDLLPQHALKGKVVLPLATAGSPHHMLALDYALRPVLQALGAHLVLPGVYATDSQVALTPERAYVLAPDLEHRLEQALDALQSEVLRTGAADPQPVAFERVLCSV